MSTVRPEIDEMEMRRAAEALSELSLFDKLFVFPLLTGLAMFNGVDVTEVPGVILMLRKQQKEKKQEEGKSPARAPISSENLAKFASSGNPQAGVAAHSELIRRSLQENKSEENKGE
jgi:hypothetical protein